MAGVGPHQPGFVAFGGRHQAPLLGVVVGVNVLNFPVIL